MLFSELLLGVHGEIRTHGLKIRNFVLYPAELRGHLEFAKKANSKLI